MWYLPLLWRWIKFPTALSVMLLFSAGCEKNTLAPGGFAFSGTWVEQSWNDGIQILKHGAELNSERYGFTIYNDGRFTEHAVAGDCLTPPVVWSRYEGSWELIAPDSLRIQSQSWAGPYQVDVKIIALSDRKLQIKYYYRVTTDGN